MFTSYRFGISGCLTAILLAICGSAAPAQDEVRPVVPVEGAPVPEQMLRLRELASRLASEIESFQEDVLTDLEGAQSRDLYHQADAVLQDVTRFQREIRPGTGPAGLASDFNNIDRGVMKLLSDVKALDLDKGPLVQAAVRLNYADQQLHSAISRFDPTAPKERAPVGKNRDVIARQAKSLALESAALVRWAKNVVADGERGDLTIAAMQRFADQATELHEVFEKGTEPKDFDRDFAALDQTWRRVVTTLNAMTPGENHYLRRKADRIEQVVEQMHVALGLEAKRPVISFETARPRP